MVTWDWQGYHLHCYGVQSRTLKSAKSFMCFYSRCGFGNSSTLFICVCFIRAWSGPFSSRLALLARRHGGNTKEDIEGTAARAGIWA